LSQAPAPNIRLAPTLRATSSGVRTLHYLGGEVPNREAAIKFVESCYDLATGGFSDMPKGKPDVTTTAIGLMAVVELKMPKEKYARDAIKYMTENAKGFDEIRIAAAGLESVKMASPRNKAWLEAVKVGGNGDETFGKGPGKARTTGSVVVTILRLGGKVDNVKGVLATLNEGQRKDGGWGKDTDAANSDLETTYRVMRCYMMLKATPANVDALRSFMSKCRNADGGYGVMPGQTSTVSGTYYVAIVQQWLKSDK
jgi:hypothetical protein